MVAFYNKDNEPDFDLEKFLKEILSTDSAKQITRIRYEGYLEALRDVYKHLGKSIKAIEKEMEKM